MIVAESSTFGFQTFAQSGFRGVKIAEAQLRARQVAQVLGVSGTVGPLQPAVDLNGLLEKSGRLEILALPFKKPGEAVSTLTAGVGAMPPIDLERLPQFRFRLAPVSVQEKTFAERAEGIGHDRAIIAVR